MAVALGKPLASWPTARELHRNLVKKSRIGANGQGKQPIKGPHHELESRRLAVQPMFHTPQKAGRSYDQECPGAPAAIVEGIGHPRGHQLCHAWAVETEEWFMWRSVCGAHALVKP